MCTEEGSNPTPVDPGVGTTHLGVIKLPINSLSARDTVRKDARERGSNRNPGNLHDDGEKSDLVSKRPDKSIPAELQILVIITATSEDFRRAYDCSTLSLS